MTAGFVSEIKVPAAVVANFVISAAENKLSKIFERLSGLWTEKQIYGQYIIEIP